uniref:SPRY domain-containing protein n=1 Tax=Oryza punctata TaxID=4537 RepID=A0A0E0K2E4_ORYPU
MALWLKLFLSVFLPVAALVAVAVLVYRRRSSSRNAPPELPESVAGGGGVVGGGGGDPAASPGLGKLNIRYNATSGRAGLRFQQLHHHHGHVDVRHHRGGGGGQQGPFQWADHPRLVTEAAENGWAQFVFAVAPPRTRSASSSPLWGLCPACDSGTSRDMADSAWEVPAGSSERMQAVRLNPVVTTAAAVSASTKKWLPGSIPSPLRGGDQDAAGNSNALCLARMSLPLPGPPLAGAPFPQDAYFEITIIYLNTRRPEWSASRASRRGRDGSSESDRVKLISFAPDAKNATQETRAATKFDDHHDKQRHTVMSLGLAAASAAPPRPSLAGTYASSIGFHSNGAVYLDGMKLVYESEKSSWAGVDKVVGCGFEPAKRKVFFTVDGQLVHAVSCNADAFSTPMYPVLASSFDVMALVNLGQGKFRYAPANARRTANPCFLRAASTGDDGRSGGSLGLDFDDSGELFSMGRVDSGWLETASRMSKSRKDNGGGVGSASAGDPDADSDLFEISLRD